MHSHKLGRNLCPCRCLTLRYCTRYQQEQVPRRHRWSPEEMSALWNIWSIFCKEGVQIRLRIDVATFVQTQLIHINFEISIWNSVQRFLARWGDISSTVLQVWWQLAGSRWWRPMGFPVGNPLPRTRLVVSPSVASLGLPLDHGS